MGTVFRLLIAGDALAAILAFALAKGLQHEFGQLREISALNVGQCAFFAAVVLLGSNFCEIYRDDAFHQHKKKIYRIAVNLLLSFIGLSSGYYVFAPLAVPSVTLVTALVIFGWLQFFWHYFSTVVHRIPGVDKNLLIIGVGRVALKTLEALRCNTHHDYHLVGFIPPNGEEVRVPLRQVIGTIDQLAELVEREHISKVVVAVTERRGVLPVFALLKCRFKGVEFVNDATFYEELTGKLSLESINPDWFIYSNGFSMTALQCFYMRSRDVVLALVGLLLLLPLLPLVAVAIKIDSSGPVLFRQVRVGARGNPFEILKFRTMAEDAEKISGAVWAQDNDPRITRVGRFLRKTRLDELPQLFNVLKGEMAFIGPRPERPEFVSRLEEDIPYYGERHVLKPGVTGWAQIKYPYGSTVEDALEKLKYDLYYIKNYSLWFDLLIVLETIKVVLFGRGAK